ncbi:MAG TPA: hypothetical protein K8V81_00480 [Brachybacterium massiliense]|uniref:Uncharacterized protein n=1 Tax=Brachybacterium massiliense TaxID=1755098 RepID=A0A921MTR3_9MICO|nr:hypothetical protein [Brachybacterium massiliense]
MSDGQSPTPAPRKRPSYGLPGPTTPPTGPAAQPGSAPQPGSAAQPGSAPAQPDGSWGGSPAGGSWGSPSGGAPSGNAPADPYAPQTGPLPGSVSSGHGYGAGYGPGPGQSAPQAPRRRRGLWPLIIGLVLLVGVAPVVTIGGFIWSISSLAGDATTGPVPMEGATAQIEVPANEMLIVYVPKADEATAECTAEGADPGAVTTVPSSSDTTFGNGEEYVQVLGIAAVQDTTVTVTCTGTDAPAHLGPYSMVSMAGPLLIGLVVGVLAGLIGLVLTVIGIVKLVRSRRA